MVRWNKVTWYSKLVALILFVALPFIGFYLGIQYGKLIAAANAPTPPTSPTLGAYTLPEYYTNTAEWQTDMRNEANAGFAIAYPIDFTPDDNYSMAPSTDWRLGANGAPGIKFLAITVPRAFDPQTNFGDATLTVGASANNQALADCLTPGSTAIPGNSVASTTVNGISFTVFTSEDAGAGNFYETTSYRTTHAGKCWAVEYTIHSSQIANYPQSYNLHPFDEAMIKDVLNRMVSTFHFE